MARKQRNADAEQRRQEQFDQSPIPEEDEVPEDEEDQATGPTKAKIDAVRHVLAENPDMKPAKGVVRIKDLFGIIMSPSHFSAAKSQIRARERDGADSTAGHFEPTLTHLRLVKEGLKALAEGEAFRTLQDEPDDLEQWVQLVSGVGNLAGRVGGLSQLEKCLAALLEIRANR